MKITIYTGPSYNRVGRDVEYDDNELADTIIARDFHGDRAAFLRDCQTRGVNLALACEAHQWARRARRDGV